MRTTGEAMRDRIVQAIDELTATNSRPPTNRELGQHLGGKSTGHIDYHLRILKERGVIHHDAKKSRGISLVDHDQREPIPIGSRRVPVLGSIAAGRPIEATVETDEYVSVPGLSSSAGGDGLYALRVRGTSMIDDLIDDGDIVVIRPQETAVDGDTVVALLEGPTESGEATLKRFYRERDRVRLEPRNRTMEPIYVAPNDLRIQGKVVTVIRQLS
ncbi:MAG TPA: transcriptional repressor LexA [Chloroflexota bacterium]|nr:transcriptional repressor LexA [Chloroflexota bacterium]